MAKKMSSFDDLQYYGTEEMQGDHIECRDISLFDNWGNGKKCVTISQFENYFTYTGNGTMTISSEKIYADNQLFPRDIIVILPPEDTGITKTTLNIMKVYATGIKDTVSDSSASSYGNWKMTNLKVQYQWQYPGSSLGITSPQPIKGTITFGNDAKVVFTATIPVNQTNGTVSANIISYPSRWIYSGETSTGCEITINSSDSGNTDVVVSDGFYWRCDITRTLDYTGFKDALFLEPTGPADVLNLFSSATGSISGEFTGDFYCEDKDKMLTAGGYSDTIQYYVASLDGLLSSSVNYSATATIDRNHVNSSVIIPGCWAAFIYEYPLGTQQTENTYLAKATEMQNEIYSGGTLKNVTDTSDIKVGITITAGQVD